MPADSLYLKMLRLESTIVLLHENDSERTQINKQKWIRGRIIQGVKIHYIDKHSNSSLEGL
jgi:hypothetical protein